MEHVITKWRPHNTCSSTIAMIYAKSDTNDAHFNIFMANIAICDTVEHHTPTLLGQNTFIHGKKQIGYILASKDINRISVGTGNTPFGQ